MTRALERYREGSAAVIPVILRACDWSLAPFASLQVLPTDAKPVVSWKDRDEAWTTIAREIRRKLEKLTNKPAPLPPQVPLTEPAREESAALQSTASLHALRTLMQIKPEVRAAVEKFATGFADASRQIDLLVSLKDVHDQLHTLHFRCYNFVMQEGRKGPGSITWESLIDPEATLGQALEELKQITTQAALQDSDTTWLSDLADAYEELTRANKNQSGKQLKQAAHLLNRVLSVQPSQVNVRLREVARNLPIAELETTMRNVSGQLDAAQLKSPEGVRFQSGLAALSKLNVNLSALAKQHDQWQAIDAEMRRIDRELTENIEDLELSWPGLKKRLERLCAEDVPWAKTLQVEVNRLDSAVDAELPADMRQAFRRCYAQAGIRFYQVDLELKKLCDELRETGKVLSDIWRSI